MTLTFTTNNGITKRPTCKINSYSSFDSLKHALRDSAVNMGSGKMLFIRYQAIYQVVKLKRKRRQAEVQSLCFSFEVPQLGIGLKRPWRQALIEVARPAIQAQPVIVGQDDKGRGD